MLSSAVLSAPSVGSVRFPAVLEAILSQPTSYSLQYSTHLTSPLTPPLTPPHPSPRPLQYLHSYKQLMASEVDTTGEGQHSARLAEVEMSLEALSNVIRNNNGEPERAWQ